MPLPIAQFHAAPGSIDLAWGHPDPDLLSADLLSIAAARTLRRYGPDALAYGAPQGAGPLIQALRGHLGAIDGRAPAVDEILVTAGASAGLDQVATLLCQPGDVALVESPTYHLAVRILRDHPIDLVPIARTTNGIDLEDVGRVLANLRRQGRRPRLLYAVTTFSNPTSSTLSAPERRHLAELVEAEGLILVEDDTYRELWYDEPPPPSVWAIAGGAGVIRLGSFSKTLAPGLRLGYLTASADVVATFAGGGLLDSGGGNGHFVALVVAELIGSGDYQRFVEGLQVAYRSRRDALVAGLTELGLRVRVPKGGYFAWLDVGQPADGPLLEAARDAGTNYVPGSAFMVEPQASQHARLSFSRYPPEQLHEAAKRLGEALQRGGTRHARRISGPSTQRNSI